MKRAQHLHMGETSTAHVKISLGVEHNKDLRLDKQSVALLHLLSIIIRAKLYYKETIIYTATRVFITHVIQSVNMRST